MNMFTENININKVNNLLIYYSKQKTNNYKKQSMLQNFLTYSLVEIK